MPAVVLLGLLIGLVVLEGVLASRSAASFRPVVNGAAGVLLIVVASALILADPSFAAMTRIANNNGSLWLALISTMNELALLCVIVLIGSVAVLYRWVMLNGDAERTKMAVMKYVGLYGISVAGLCLLQIGLLKLGHGSEYAAKKYVFGLNTVVLLEVALLPNLLIKLNRGVAQKDLPSLCRSLLPFGVIVASLLCIVPPVRTLDVARVVLLEKQIGAMRDTVIPQAPGKYNYAVNLGASPAADFLISVGVLNAPIDLSYPPFAHERRSFSELSTVGTIVTSEHHRPYDIEACRRFVSTSGLVLVDGSCLGRTLTTYELCQGTIDFSDWISPKSVQGFSEAEPHGRWTDATHAIFQCTVPQEKQQQPTAVKIVSHGFVTGNHSQRAFISINGGPPMEYRYEAGQAEKIIELPLPHDLTGELQISFSLPDAVSPQSLGMSSDPRNLGIGVRSIEFK